MMITKNHFTFATCGHHEKIGSLEYFNIFFDNGKYTEFSKGLFAGDPLGFEDTKKYVDRIKNERAKTGMDDAIRVAHGKMNKEEFVIAAMDFKFIGGSMGSVVGEKIARAIDKAIELNCPFMIISKSGGARMMEAGLSLCKWLKRLQNWFNCLMQNFLHFIIDGSYNRWCYGFFCYAGRFKYI
jgi:acetyl-CoA carboxylase carboxyl transferase subunit beta